MEIDLESLLGTLLRARGRGTTLKALEQEFASGAGGRQKLRKALRQLMREGRAQSDGHHFRAAQPADERAPVEQPAR